MKDIDFDELDRAVNSIMDGGGKKPSSSSNQPVVTPPASPQTASEPAPAPDSEATAIPVKRTAPPAQPQRPSGRFMDVVSGGSSKARPTAEPSREGVTVTPRPSSDSLSPSAPADKETPTEKTEPADSVDDPKVTVTIEPETKPSSEPEATEPPAPTSPPFGSDIPLESPFISDAKVEKRPLNAGSSAEPEPASEPKSSDKTDGQAFDPIPEEFSADLIALESDEAPDPDATSDAKPVTEPTPELVPVDHRISDQPAMRSAPTSIMPQYKEQPSSGDQSHAAIYDTTHIAEPLAHPAKQKSGWLWVVWVILLLGIGAGGAVLLNQLSII